MRDALSDLVPIAELALDLGEVDRATRHADGVTPETDTTHSLMLALVAYSLAPLHMELDRELVLRLALVHDLDEVVHAFALRVEKLERELDLIKETVKEGVPEVGPQNEKPPHY